MQSLVPCYEGDVGALGFITDYFDVMNNSKDLWIVLGIEHEFYYSNSVWYHWHNINRGKYNLAGKVYSQIPHDAYSKCAGLFEEHDRLVIDSKVVVPSIEIHQYDCFNGWMAMFSKTIPIIQDGEVTNLIIKAKPLPKHYIQFYKNIQSVCWDEDGDMNMYLRNPENLHDAYFDTVYLYMLGFKSKEISR